MSWLRIEDQMPINAKVGELSDAEFRALIALWGFCARRGNGGIFYARELKHAVYTSPKGSRHVAESQLERFAELSLVVPEGDVYQVNDWEKYQPKDPTGADRQRAYRERHA